MVRVRSNGSDASIHALRCEGNELSTRAPRVSNAPLIPVFTTRSMDRRNSTQRQRAACS